jgi:SAM-dependent methyltransferase
MSEYEHFDKLSNEEKKQYYRDLDKTPEAQTAAWNQLLAYKIITEQSLHEIQNADSAEALGEYTKARRKIAGGMRDIQNIADLYNMSPENLREALMNKKVLDVGTGHSIMAQEFEDERFPIEMFSIDISLKSLRERDSHEPKVVAKAEALPFADKSFDVVMANWSLPIWSMSIEQMQQSLAENIRVLKVGGQAFHVPNYRFRGATANC